MAGNESSEMTPDQARVGVESPADGRAHDDGDDLAPVERFNRMLRRSGVRREARGCEASGCKDTGTWQAIRHAGSSAATLSPHQDSGHSRSTDNDTANHGERRPEADRRSLQRD